MSYFTLGEFKCKCCNLDAISPEFIKKLDKLREDCGFPFIVTSGCRCTSHNIQEGGKENSAHLVKEDGYTHAADIQVIGSYKRFIFIKNALKYFNRIGVGDSFIHVDDYSKNGEEVIWTY